MKVKYNSNGHGINLWDTLDAGDVFTGPDDYACMRTDKGYVILETGEHVDEQTRVMYVHPDAVLSLQTAGYNERVITVNGKQYKLPLGYRWKVHSFEIAQYRWHHIDSDRFSVAYYNVIECLESARADNERRNKG